MKKLLVLSALLSAAPSLIAMQRINRLATLALKNGQQRSFSYKRSSLEVLFFGHEKYDESLDKLIKIKDERADLEKQKELRSFMLLNGSWISSTLPILSYELWGFKPAMASASAGCALLYFQHMKAIETANQIALNDRKGDEIDQEIATIMKKESKEIEEALKELNIVD